MDFNNISNSSNLIKLERKYEELTQQLAKEVIKFASGEYLGDYRYIVKERAILENAIRQVKAQLGE